MSDMNTSSFLSDLAAYIRGGQFRCIYDEVVAKYLYRYLDYGRHDGRIPEYEYTGIYHYLPLYIQDAFDALRTSNEPWIFGYREEYLKASKRDHVPDLVNISFGGVDRALMIQSLGQMLWDITGHDFLRQNTEKYFGAQDQVLEQVIHEFITKVYRTGMRDILAESRSAGFSGTFGSVTLRSLYTAGRIMFTFSRENSNNPFGEDSVSIVGEQGEKEGVRFGTQSVHAEFFTAVTLLREVISRWPGDHAEQEEIYRPDPKISIGF